MRVLLDLLAPHGCASCGEPASLPPWCRACTPTVPPEPGCRRCGDLRGHLRCPFEDTPVVSTLVTGAYDGPVGDAIRAAKTAHAWAGWDRLGRGLAAMAASRLTPAVDAVTWVPADPRRRRRRGRDHAHDLAQHVAARLGLPATPLLRARPRRSDQATLALHERRRLGADTFLAQAAAPPTVVLVDDVVATGATARAAATALRGAGARSIHLVALARAGAGTGTS